MEHELEMKNADVLVGPQGTQQLYQHKMSRI
jgi:hypothetical protein